MSDPKTLLQMAGADLTPPSLSEAALILIDCQREYVDGGLPLPGVDSALQEAAIVLENARSAGAPVVHIAHQGKAGGAFDPDGPGGQIADHVAPISGEAVIAKSLPNAFAGTDLDNHLRALEVKNLILVGFMTHMCVSSTARAALDLGYSSTIIAEATATRDLPNPAGGVIEAADLQAASLAALSDRFAIIADNAVDLIA